MVVITGRPAKEIDPLLRGNPPVIDPMLKSGVCMGQSGCMPMAGANCSKLRRNAAQLDELREHLRHNNLGGQFEDKPNAAVMHWRGRFAAHCEVH